MKNKRFMIVHDRDRSWTGHNLFVQTSMKKNNIFFTEQTNFPKDFETNFVLKKTILFYWINDFYKQLFEKR